MLPNSNTQIPSVLNTLLLDTYQEYENTNDNYVNALLSVLRKNHYWPALQIKKFHGNNNMVLLHNTYKRIDTTEFQELYDICRSVIIDFSLPIGENIVVTYANSICNRISDSEYEKTAEENDICEVAYDSTMISIYFHNDKWYFGTTSCPSVDSSKFSHPTKKHGTMFNEILHELFPDVSSTESIREVFTNNLDKENVYEFAIVHYENTKFVDYTKEFGENYKKLFHISTKKKGGIIIDHINTLENLGILYPKRFNNYNEALIELREKEQDIFAIIVSRDNKKICKVSLNMMIFKEDTDPGNPNPWRNMIWVYQQNRNDYHINDYIKQYTSGIECPLDNFNKPMDPTYIIHTVFSTIKDILHNLYITTTKYYPKYNRFKMDKVLDKKLPPILQYHLAQLRHKQVTTYKDTNAIITINDVFYYLCHCNNVKNIVSLVNFFSNNSGFDINQRQSLCFSVLSGLLH
tara:strand:+ start:17020 stop:18408 length:1389 start_codon:yes stop_codon:yes gene_type:complete